MVKGEYVSDKNLMKKARKRYSWRRVLVAARKYTLRGLGGRLEIVVEADTWDTSAEDTFKRFLKEANECGFISHNGEHKSIYDFHTITSEVCGFTEFRVIDDRLGICAYDILYKRSWDGTVVYDQFRTSKEREIVRARRRRKYYK